VEPQNDPETQARLNAYVARLASADLNVTGTRDPEALRIDHVGDALTLLPLLPPPLPPGGPGGPDVSDAPVLRLVDIGSGGGLPGIPLAIARPDLRVTLLEATARKVGFLESCARTLDLPGVTVCGQRAEEAGHDPDLRERFDLATCRAVGALREILEYTLPLLKVGGVLLAPKAKTAAEEIAAASTALQKLGGAVPTIHSTGAGDRVVVRVVKERPTPDGWPRRPGRPRKSPL